MIKLTKQQTAILASAHTQPGGFATRPANLKPAAATKVATTSPSRQLSGDLLRRMVMHHVQELCLGALDRKLAAMLDRMADGVGGPSVRLKIGSVLAREHGGILHQVTVVPDGFAWDGRVLPSLSAAAYAITGTKWNGHRFFGLSKAVVTEVLVEAGS